MAEAVSSGTFVHSWDASYYDNRSQKWIYGHLDLFPNSLCFERNSSTDHVDKDQLSGIQIPFFKIRDINKSRSSLLFPSVVVGTEESELHWFSSFSNREETFMFLKHFMNDFTKKALTSSDAPKSESVHTELGSRLLQSVSDSQNTLQKAAENLVGQGHQLSNAACTMGMMHQDLEVSSRITKGLDSWFGRWRLPRVTEYSPEKMILVKDIDVPDIHDTEALCSFTTNSTPGPRQLCVFRVSKEGLTVLDMKQKILHSFRWQDISRVMVVSPWEIMVSQFCIGKADFSYNVVAVNMPSILFQLQKFGADKLEYLTPMDRSSQQLKPSGLKLFSQAKTFLKDPTVSGSRTSKPLHSDQLCVVSDEASSQKGAVSDFEIDEISSHLKKLKSLALDVGAEEDRQLKIIDDLSCSVARADDRVKGLNNKLNSL